MRWSLVVVLLLALALAPPARASDNPAVLAAAVKRDIVHVEPRAKARVTVAEAGRLRIRIVQKANGRIKILVVPAITARRNGGIEKLASTVAQRAQAPGALLVVAGSQVWISTTYDSGPALTAVQGAVADNEGKRITAALLDSIDRLAEVDPGASAEEGGGPGSPAGIPGDGGFGNVLDDIGDTIKTVLLGIGGLIAVLILIPIVVILYRLWRGRAEGAEELEVGRTRAREELVAVGDLVRELDIDAEMPGADAAGKDALGRAIELYHRADRELAKASSTRRLQRARATLGEARREAELARRQLTGVAGPVGIPGSTSGAQPWNVDA